jgi:hypothetical protein
MQNKVKFSAGMGGLLAPSRRGAPPIRLSWLPRTFHKFECWRPNEAGIYTLVWSEEVENLTVNTGLNDILTQYWKGSGYTASFFVGLKSAGTIAAADTMASHSGWTDSAGYSNATRPALTLGTVASQSVDNSASKAVFNINATATIAGAFICTNSTVSGTTGTLIGASDFASSRSVLSGDTLNVQITNTAS